MPLTHISFHLASSVSSESHALVKSNKVIEGPGVANLSILFGVGVACCAPGDLVTMVWFPDGRNMPPLTRPPLVDSLAWLASANVWDMGREGVSLVVSLLSGFKFLDETGCMKASSFTSLEEVCCWVGCSVSSSMMSIGTRRRFGLEDVFKAIYGLKGNQLLTIDLRCFACSICIALSTPSSSFFTDVFEGSSWRALLRSTPGYYFQESVPMGYLPSREPSKFRNACLACARLKSAFTLLGLNVRTFVESLSASSFLVVQWQ